MIDNFIGTENHSINLCFCRRSKIWRRVICILMAAIIVLTSLLMLQPVSAREGANMVSADRTADPSTLDNYTSTLNIANNSMYAGRVWADKSVFAYGKDSGRFTSNVFNLDPNLDGATGKVALEDDFLHVFSVLSSSQAWIGLPPTKTVIIIDNSGSMYTNQSNWGDTRMGKLLAAVNSAVDSLMRAGSYNEVSVVSFGNGTKNGVSYAASNTADVIIPMGHYPVSANHSNPYKYLNGDWTQSGATDLPKVPVQTRDTASTGGGYIFVDKQYVNEACKVDSSMSGKTGLERYNLFRNGTTNIQAGIYVGCQTLLEEETSINVGGYKFDYIPNLVVLTDGEITDALDNNWQISGESLAPSGFLNDFSDKSDSFIGIDTQDNACSWDQFVEEYNVGKYKWRTIGGAAGSEVAGTAHRRLPTAEGLEKLRELYDYYINGKSYLLFSTLMTAAYGKSAINNTYAQDCKMYTVSLDMTDPGKPEDAKIYSSTKDITMNGPAMNPNAYFNRQWLDLADFDHKPYYDDGTVGRGTNSAIYRALDWFDSWKKGENITTTYREILSGSSSFYGGDKTVIENVNTAGAGHSSFFRVSQPKTFTIKQLDPNDKYNVKKEQIEENIYYSYKSYYATSTESAVETMVDIEKVFNEITDDINQHAFTPVQGTNSAGVQDSMTYMDPMGQYMEVKDVKSLSLFGNVFDITKTGVYDYDVCGTGSDFTEGWYKYNEKGELIFYGAGVPSGCTDNKAAWKAGYVYYVSAATARKFVSTLPEDGMTEQQRATTYTLYRFDLDSDQQAMDRINPCYGFKDENKDGIISEDEKTVNNAVQKYQLNSIRIWVENSGDYQWDSDGGEMMVDPGFDQALYVNIPTEAIPIQVATISLGDNGNEVNYSTNLDDKTASTPLRVFYTVGVQSDIMFDNGSIDIAALDEKYLESHKDDKTGKVWFLSNYYSKNTYDGYISGSISATRGNPVVTFSPGGANRYYLYQQTRKIYWAAPGTAERPQNLTIGDFDGADYSTIEQFENNYKYVNAVDPASSAHQFNADDWYYVPLNYYKSTGKGTLGESAHIVVARKGSEFGSGFGEEVGEGAYVCWYNTKTEEIAEFSNTPPSTGQREDWILATKPQGLRVGDLSRQIGLKGKNIGDDSNTSVRPADNPTSSADSYFMPTIGNSTSEDTKGNILVNIFLGNNGRLEVNDTMLLVTKEVDLHDLPYSNKEFHYQGYIQGFTGTMSAIVIAKNEYTGYWQRRISTVDLLTDNNEFLAGRDNNIIRANADGTINPNGDYYIYVGHNTASGDTGSDYSLRIYDSDLNADGVTLLRGGRTIYVPKGYDTTENPDNVMSGDIYKQEESGKHSAGTLVLWVRDVYVVPIADVEDGTFNKDDYHSAGADSSFGKYLKLSQFPIAEIDSTQDDSSFTDIESDYSVRVEYLTRDLEFGPSDLTLYDTNSFKPGSTNVTSENAKLSTAEFTLKNGEGLLFRGINLGADYRFTEKMMDYEIDSGYALNHVDHNTEEGSCTTYSQDGSIWEAYQTDSGGEREYLYKDGKQLGTDSVTALNDFNTKNHTYSVFGETSSYEEAVHYSNEFAPVQMSVSKDIISSKGTQIKDDDYKKAFDFTITISYADGTPIDGFYWFRTYDIKTGNLVSEEEKELDSSGKTTFKLNGGQRVMIYGLPVGAKYTYSVHEADQLGWNPEVEVDGGDIVESGEYSGSILQGSDGIIGGELEFINVKQPPEPAVASLDAEKRMAGDSFTLSAGMFSFRITPDKSNPEGDPIGARTVYNNDKGAIVLFENERFTLQGVYKYTVEELSGDPIPGITYDSKVYTVTVDVIEDLADEGALDGYYGQLKANISVTQDGAPVSDGIAFTNVFEEEPEYGYLTVSKQVDNAVGKDSTPFNFTVKFTPPAEKPFGESIPAVHADKDGKGTNETVAVTPNGDGSYTATFTLKHSETMTFKDLPNGTKYSVTEASCKGYKLKSSSNTENSIVAGETVHADFVNELLIELPDLGGTGVTPYYVGGAFLMLAAAVYFTVEHYKKVRSQKNIKS